MNNLMKKLLPYLFVLPALLIVLLFIVYPVADSFIKSFTDVNNNFTWENYLYFFQTEQQQHNILYTLYIVVFTCLLATIIGYLLALYIRFSTTKLSKIVAGMNLLPRFIPGLVAVYGMMNIIRDSGLIYRIGLLFNQEWKIGFMYNSKGIILMNLWFNIPFATMIISAALASVPASLIESAKDIGTHKIQIFSKIILPLTYKDALVALTFICMSNIGSFTTPYLMGENAPKMLGVVLYELFGYVEYNRAAALSVIMFLLCAASATIYIYTNLKKEAWEATR